MVFEQIEKIKQEYTDKYVQVDANRAELARFKNLVGQVKTVNMSGRALVEFLDYHLNIGWFDIDLDYLKVVDKPLPKPPEEKKAVAKKPAAKAAPKQESSEKKLSPLEMARQADSGGTKKAAPAKKQSTADVLAALRGEKSAGSEKPAAKPAEQKAEKPAAKQASGGAEKVDRSKMSVAEMIAAARGEKAPAATETAKSEPEVEETTTAEPEAEATTEPESEAASPPTEAGSSGAVDKSGMSIDEIIAYCREHDAS